MIKAIKQVGESYRNLMISKLTEELSGMLSTTPSKEVDLDTEKGQRLLDIYVTPAFYSIMQPIVIYQDSSGDIVFENMLIVPAGEDAIPMQSSSEVYLDDLDTTQLEAFLDCLRD